MIRISRRPLVIRVSLDPLIFLWLTFVWDAEPALAPSGPPARPPKIEPPGHVPLYLDEEEFYA